MKTTMKLEQEVEIVTVVIAISPRYVGDDDDDDMPTDFPLLNDSKMWTAHVDIDTGIIKGWPEGDVREMHVKVCDAGTYRLLDASGKEIAAIVNDYVPHGVVPGSWGDYVELSIDGTGRIINWPKSPDVSQFFDDD